MRIGEEETKTLGEMRRMFSGPSLILSDCTSVFPKSFRPLRTRREEEEENAINN